MKAKTDKRPGTKRLDEALAIATAFLVVAGVLLGVVSLASFEAATQEVFPGKLLSSALAFAAAITLFGSRPVSLHQAPTKVVGTLAALTVLGALAGAVLLYSAYTPSTDVQQLAIALELATIIAASAATMGLPRLEFVADRDDDEAVRQEPKYRAVGGRFVHRKTGLPIPLEEPVFVVRAQDAHSLELLSLYSSRCKDAEQRRGVLERLAAFTAFQQNYPERVREPDTDRELIIPVRTPTPDEDTTSAA